MVKELVAYTVKQLVAHPEAVKVYEIEQDQASLRQPVRLGLPSDVQAEDKIKLLKIEVDTQDTGKVIGKDGQSIKAIRALVALFKTAEEPFEDVIIDS